MTKFKVPFRNFAKAPKIRSKQRVLCSPQTFYSHEYYFRPRRYVVSTFASNFLLSCSPQARRVVKLVLSSFFLRIFLLEFWLKFCVRKLLWTNYVGLKTISSRPCSLVYDWKWLLNSSSVLCCRIQEHTSRSRRNAVQVYFLWLGSVWNT
jgi:hypothetical protein